MQRIDVSEYPLQDPTIDPVLGDLGAVPEGAKELSRCGADTAGQQSSGVLANVGSDPCAQAPGRVPAMAGQAATGTRRLARWGERTTTPDMLRPVDDSARRGPVAFLPGGPLVGVVAGQLSGGKP